MVTGASTADARRDPRSTPARACSPRPAATATSCRCSASARSSLAVNKLDLVDYSQEVFDADRGRLPGVRRRDRPRRHRRASRCRRCGATTSPSRAPTRPGTTGPTLIEHLETVEIDDDAAAGPFRMPVQWVNRPDLDFRGFSGRSSAGRVRPGDPVRVLPSGRTSTVARIVTVDGDLDEAVAGQSVTLTLADEIDVSRGDVLAAADVARRRRRPVRGPRRLDGRASAMLPGRPYLLKIGTRTVGVTVAAAQVQGQRQHPRAHRGQDARAQRDRRLQPQPRPADRRSTPTPRTATWAGSSSSTGSPTPPSAPACSTSRCAASHNVHWQAIEVDKRRPRRAQGPAARRRVVHRPLRRRQVDHRQPGRAAAARPRACTPTCSTATTSATASTGPRLHRRRPGREHPPRRRGRPADGRRRPDRARVVHLAVPRPSGGWPASWSSDGRVRRGLRRHPARGRRGTRPEGPLRARPGAASSPTSPASTRPTRRPSTPRSTSTPPARSPPRRPPSRSSSTCAGPASSRRRHARTPTTSDPPATLPGRAGSIDLEVSERRVGRGTTIRAMLQFPSTYAASAPDRPAVIVGGDRRAP